MSVYKYLDLSTAHVTKDVMAPEANPFYLVATYEYGAFFYVPSEDTESFAPDTTAPSLLAVLAYAKQNGCTLVRLDRDANTVDALPIYEW